VWPASVTPEVCDSSETIAPSGSTDAIAWQTESAVSSPLGRSGTAACCTATVAFAAPSVSTSASRLPSTSEDGDASSCTSQPSGTR
jgi:negative regulator of sigma E activity